MSDDKVTYSFVKLQRLRASFDDLHDGRPLRRGQERTIRRLVAELGPTAVPFLSRQLESRDPSRSSWAQSLLEQLGLGLRHASDDDDPSALRDHSLRELASCLDGAAEVARAADLLVSQLDDEELLGFIDDFAEGEPERAAALLDELLVRDDVEERTRSELRRLRAPMPDPPDARRAGHTARPLVRVGRHRDGREIVLATVRRTGSRPLRYRALWAVADAGGALVDAGYQAETTGGALERDILGPVREDGFELQRAPSRAGSGKLIAAARACIAAGGVLPKDYYLGRDILGIFDEHWLYWHTKEDDLTVMLARAIDLLSVGEYARALPMLERYVVERPDDAEGHANLGVCLMATGELGLACDRLAQAAEIEPANAMHHWNLAAAAHRSRQPGRCYLALSEYLDRIDPRTDAHLRRHAARRLVAEYERLTRLEHPDVDPAAVARGE